MNLFIIIFLSLFVSRPLGEAYSISAIRFLPLITFLLGTIRFLYVKKGTLGFSVFRERKGFLAYLAVILVYGISIFRVSGGGVTSIAVANYMVQFLLIFVFSYVYLNYQFNLKPDFEYQVRRFIRGLVLVMNVFLLLNFVAYLGGITADTFGIFKANEPSMLGGLMGLGINRNSYFLTGHPNSFGVFLGLLSMMNFIYLLNFKAELWERVALVIMLLICLFSYAVIDSRGAIGATVGAIIILVGLRRFRLLSILPKASVVIPLLTLVFISLLQIFAETDYASSISRDPNEIASGNSRGIIWKYCIEELQEFKIDHVTGYGQLGHVNSGVSRKWARAMSGWETYTHNFLFQVIFDMGYLGVFLILMVVYLGTSYSYRLYKRGHKYMFMFLGTPLVYMFSGITEAPFGVSNYLATNTFFLVFLAPILIWDIYLKSSEFEEEEAEQSLEEKKEKSRTF